MALEALSRPANFYMAWRMTENQINNLDKNKINHLINKLDILYGALRLIMDRCEYETDEAYVIGEQALKEINVL